MNKKNKTDEDYVTVGDFLDEQGEPCVDPDDFDELFSKVLSKKTAAELVLEGFESYDEFATEKLKDYWKNYDSFKLNFKSAVDTDAENEILQNYYAGIDEFLGLNWSLLFHIDQQLRDPILPHLLRTYYTFHSRVSPKKFPNIHNLLVHCPLK